MAGGHETRFGSGHRRRNRNGENSVNVRDCKMFGSVFRFRLRNDWVLGNYCSVLFIFSLYQVDIRDFFVIVKEVFLIWEH
jgi:hypothetical protein